MFYGILDIMAKPVFGALLIWGHRNIEPGRLGSKCFPLLPLACADLPQSTSATMTLHPTLKTVRTSRRLPTVTTVLPMLLSPLASMSKLYNSDLKVDRYHGYWLSLSRKLMPLNIIVCVLLAIKQRRLDQSSRARTVRNTCYDSRDTP